MGSNEQTMKIFRNISNISKHIRLVFNYVDIRFLRIQF